jgi:hypothetical protein
MNLVTYLILGGLSFSCSQQPLSISRIASPNLKLNSVSNENQIGTSAFQFSENYEYANSCDADLVYNCNINTVIAVGAESVGSCHLVESSVSEATCFSSDLKNTLSAGGANIKIKRLSENQYLLTLMTSKGIEKTMTVDSNDIALLQMSRSEGVIDQL